MKMINEFKKLRNSNNQLFVNFGDLFSMNAFTPSILSAVPINPMKRFLSYSLP
jgi:hypothetical protein